MNREGCNVQSSWIRVACYVIVFASLTPAMARANRGAADALPMQASPNVVNGVYKNAEHGLQLKLAPEWGEGESSLPGSIALFYPPNDKPGTLNLFHRDPAGKDADGVIASLQKEIRDHDANAKIEPTKDAKLGG